MAPGFGLQSDVPFSVSADYGNDDYATTAWLNGGTAEQTGPGDQWTQFNLSYHGIGFGYGVASYQFYGTVHALRLYNRALTAAEIAANYAVDKERFNLP